MEGMSRSEPIVQTLDRIDAAFPGELPASVVVKAKDVTAPEVKSTIKQLQDQAIATGELSEPTHVEVNPDKTVAVVSSRSRATAPTRPPTARSRSCARRSSRRPSASSAAPRSRSAA